MKDDKNVVYLEVDLLWILEASDVTFDVFDTT